MTMRYAYAVCNMYYRNRQDAINVNELQQLLYYNISIAGCTTSTSSIDFIETTKMSSCANNMQGFNKEQLIY